MSYGTTRSQTGGYTLLLCALLLSWASDAWAKPKAAIVILAGGDQDARQLTQRLRGDVEWTLLEPASVDTSASYRLVAEKVAAAKSLLSRFDHEGALKMIAEAEEELASLLVAPKDVLRELNIAAARAQLAAGNKDRAKQRLLLVHNLEPELLRLDTKLVRPELAKSYRAAIKQKLAGRDVILKLAPTELALQVDGKTVTVKEGQIRVAAGDHYLSAQAEGFRVLSKRLPAGVQGLELQLSPLAPAELLGEQMARVQDETRRPGALLAIAESANLELVFVVRGSGDALLYRREDKHASEWTPIEKTTLQRPNVTVAASNSNAPDELLTTQPPPTTKVASKPWYKSNTFKVLGVLGLLTGAVAIAFVARSDSETSYQTGMWTWDLSN